LQGFAERAPEGPPGPSAARLTRVTTATELSVTEEASWTPEEAARFEDPLLDNVAKFLPHSTGRTRLDLAKVRRGEELVGVAPLLRLVRYRGTRLLEPGTRRWLDPCFGPFARKTTCLVDTSFLAFRYSEPFFAHRAEDRGAVRGAVVRHLKACRDVDQVMISEPATDGGWAREHGFLPFLQLPLVSVELEGVASFDDYLAGLSQQRRRNLRKERQLFRESGGRFELLEPPHPPRLTRELHRCLLASSEHNAELEIPFEDLMNNEEAFRSQEQWVITARVGEALAGFFAFIPRGDVLHQCHGGLDYVHSLAVKAYPNLIHAATEHAIERGCRRLTLGPLNNEAKRRAGSLQPVMASFWCRDAASRFLMKRFLLRRFQIYGGEVG